MEPKYPIRYPIPKGREIVKTTLLYYDGKTQVPKRVIELLGLSPGSSTLVWVVEGDRIYVESATKSL